MTVKREGNVIEIEGNIKSLEDFEKIKYTIEEILPTNKIILDLKNSMSITSAVIGYLTKLSNVNGVRVELIIKDNDLYELLKDLDLDAVFYIRKV